MHLLQMCSKKDLWNWLNNWSMPQDPRGNVLEMRIPGRVFSVLILSGWGAAACSYPSVTADCCLARDVVSLLLNSTLNRNEVI